MAHVCFDNSHCIIFFCTFLFSEFCLMHMSSGYPVSNFCLVKVVDSLDSTFVQTYFLFSFRLLAAFLENKIDVWILIEKFIWCPSLASLIHVEYH